MKETKREAMGNKAEMSNTSIKYSKKQKKTWEPLQRIMGTTLPRE